MIDPALIESTARVIYGDMFGLGADPWEARPEAQRLCRKGATAVLAHLDTMGALVGDGMVAVPREPTEAMLDAAKAAFATAGPIAFADFYCAMIAASGGE